MTIEQEPKPNEQKPKPPITYERNSWRVAFVVTLVVMVAGLLTGSRSYSYGEMAGIIVFGFLITILFAWVANKIYRALKQPAGWREYIGTFIVMFLIAMVIPCLIMLASAGR